MLVKTTSGDTPKTQKNTRPKWLNGSLIIQTRFGCIRNAGQKLTLKKPDEWGGNTLETTGPSCVRQ